MESGNLNFLEPSGPPQACNETDATLDKRKKKNIQNFHSFLNLIKKLNLWSAVILFIVLE